MEILEIRPHENFKLVKSEIYRRIKGVPNPLSIIIISGDPEMSAVITTLRARGAEVVSILPKPGQTAFENLCGKRYQNFWYWEEFMLEKFEQEPDFLTTLKVSQASSSVLPQVAGTVEAPSGKVNKQSSAYLQQLYDSGGIESSFDSHEPYYPIIVIEDDVPGSDPKSSQKYAPSSVRTSSPPSSRDNGGKTGNDFRRPDAIASKQEVKDPTNGNLRDQAFSDSIPTTFSDYRSNQENSNIIPNHRDSQTRNDVSNQLVSQYELQQSNSASTPISNQLEHSLNNNAKDVKFYWKMGGTSVFVAGSWDNWTRLHSLEKVINGFESTIRIPHGLYTFLFNVDGKYTVDRFEHFIIQHDNQEANYISIDENPQIQNQPTAVFTPRKAEPNPQKKDTVFIWHGKVGQVVKLSGSWKWQKKYSMVYKDKTYFATVPLAPGTYYYRYFINGKPQNDSYMPTARVMLGNAEKTCNVINIT